MSEHNSSRREFVKRAAYVAPVILTLQAAPAFAKTGSQKEIDVPPRPGTGGPTRPSPRPSKPITQSLLDWLKNLFS